MKKLKSLLKKTQKLRLFVWKGILKNTPLSFRIHCYVKNRNDLHLNRKRSNCKSVRSLLRAKHELVRKQGKVYLSSKHKRRGYLGGVRYQNRVLSKYLSLCTCNYPDSDETSATSLRLESNYLNNVFSKNNYNTDFVSRNTHSNTDSNTQTNSDPVTTATMPYIRGISETIARILQPYNIRVAHKPMTTLRRTTAY